ncbi:MAG: CoB--CoM heterodisulfide reductase iron-sulfur subunit A family protein [Polyangiaceae bacterium]
MLTPPRDPKLDVAVYLCNCGTAISERVDNELVQLRISKEARHVKVVDLLCSEQGQREVQAELEELKPARCVFAACSPRDHEGTLMRVLERAGMNPYLMQLTNIREHVAWVTEDKAKATEKVGDYVHRAIRRVFEQHPLEDVKVEAESAVVVIGAGPAGMKAALQLAEAGRKVTLVERTAGLGGMPVLYQEIFPNLECGPCLLEPMMDDVLHGPHGRNLELMTLAEVKSVKGYFGNFSVEIAARPRHVTDQCIGCGECVAACPESKPDPMNYGRSERKAISFQFTGVLPNLPQLDEGACRRFARAEDCTACRDACPIPAVIDFDDAPRTVERRAGAVVLAVGASLFDSTKIPALGYGRVPDVVHALEFERLLSSNGPTEGQLVTQSGRTPRSLAIIHCVGSLDKNHCDYCSGICCGYAFKFNHLARHHVPDIRITHIYKEISVSGKEEFKLWEKAKQAAGVEFHRYSDVSEIQASAAEDGVRLTYPKGGAQAEEVFDMVVLCPAMVPKSDASALGRMFDVEPGPAGFYQELHGRIDAAPSKIKGVYLAGTCQGPMDIPKSINHAMASVGYVLSGLVEGRRLELKPITAAVTEDRCSGCRTCVGVCPYKAINVIAETHKASVNKLLCMGCGTCVAACPSGAMTGNHFTNEAILAEIEAVFT